MGKIVITNVEKNKILFQFNDEHEIELIKPIIDSQLNSIYIGRISEINSSLNSIFVSISKNQKVFVPYSELKSKDIKCGDNLLVQIKTEPIKTKLAQGSMDICFPGEYCVLHLYGSGVSVSKKLSKEIQDKLTTLLFNDSYINEIDYKIVIRTNAETLLFDNNIEPLINEIKKFKELADEILIKYQSLKYGSLLYSENSPLLNIFNNIQYDTYDSIITDDKAIYDNLNSLSILKNKEIKFYNEEFVSLINLYSLKTHLGRALDKKVYLKSGGYLIIEPTEALTVIDVNSGKAQGKNKENNSYFYKINKEAAVEVCKQLKIRNISGIIMIDFINMKKKEDNDKLLKLLDTELKKDRIQSTLVDMTPLGIVEITRKKVNISLDKAILL